MASGFPQDNSFLATALACLDVGISTVPPTEDGEKKPAFEWKPYQEHCPSRVQVLHWYSCGRTGVGIITGKVSGNLEMFNFDNREIYQAFRELARASGCGDLIDYLRSGYEEWTPEGVHIPYRCETIEGNLKLARRIKHDAQGRKVRDEHGNLVIETLIETRGEGGFVIIAPSNGTVHPSGKSYVLQQGGPATIQTISPEDREAILSLCRTFNEIVEKSDVQAEQDRPQATRGDRPGDQFNAKASWEEVLEPKGWVKVYTRNGITYWRRPGKDRGVSATTNYAGFGLLYVFSTSTPFEAERGYSKFSAYVLLYHNGDFRRAAEVLIRSGYEPGGYRAHARYQRYEDADTSDHNEGEEEEPIIVPPPGDSVEPFPLEVLPLPMRSLIENGAKSLHYPADLLAVHSLTLAGAAIGISREIEIKKGWRERPCLFTAVVAPPGAKKSPALKLVSSPFTERQRELYTQYQKEKEEYEEALVRYEVELTEWKKKVGKGEATAEYKPEEPEPPIFEQLFTTDSTLEALAVLQEQTPRGVLYLSDELTAWVRGFNQYKNGKGADRQVWLSFWNGAQTIVNRKNRKGPIVLDNPFVPVTGCLPPDVLPELSDECGREDGFVHRLLFSFPEPLPLQWTETELDPRILSRFSDVFHYLWTLQPESDENGCSRPRVLKFTDAAKKQWREWITTHYHEQTEETFPDQLRGPWAKLEGYCARLTLIVHCCRLAANETTSESVDEESVAAAWSLIDYFKSHARCVYRKLHTSPADRRATLALEWIKKHGERATARDLLRSNVAGVRTSSEAKKLLSDLIDRGHGKMVEKGRREVFELHQPDTRHFEEKEDETST